MFNWLRNLFRQEEEKTEIWSVVSGPTLAEDLGDEELDDLDVHDTAVRMVLKIAVGSDVFDIEAWFDSYEDAKPIADHFQKSIEPLPINLKGL
jgi:hypothetical protein